MFTNNYLIHQNKLLMIASNEF